MSDNDLGDWNAAYILGALSTEDRLAYEEYLAANPKRAAALTEFAGLPGVLNVLTPQEALALDALAGEGTGQTRPLDLMPSLARAAAKRQKRSRRIVIAVVGTTAAVFLAVGVFVTAVVVGTGATPSPIGATPPLQGMAQTDRGGISASLAVTAKAWGTRLDWKCQYTKAWSKNATSYDLVITTDDGKQTPVASWSPSSGDEASGLAAATSIATSQIRRIDIRVSGTATPLAETTLR